MPGWLPLVFGGIAALFMQVAAFSTLANPIFLAALVAYGFGRNRISGILAATSIVIGASFFPLSWSYPVLIPFSGQGETLNHPEPMVGFVLWMMSFLVIFLGGTASYARQKLTKNANSVVNK
jgi:ABC-type glycerol-3-phosphate transport system permease component